MALLTVILEPSSIVNMEWLITLNYILDPGRKVTLRITNISGYGSGCPLYPIRLVKLPSNISVNVMGDEVIIENEGKDEARGVIRLVASVIGAERWVYRGRSAVGKIASITSSWLIPYPYASARVGHRVRVKSNAALTIHVCYSLPRELTPYGGDRSPRVGLNTHTIWLRKGVINKQFLYGEPVVLGEKGGVAEKEIGIHIRYKPLSIFGLATKSLTYIVILGLSMKILDFIDSIYGPHPYFDYDMLEIIARFFFLLVLTSISRVALKLPDFIQTGSILFLQNLLLMVTIGVYSLYIVLPGLVTLSSMNMVLLAIKVLLKLLTRFAAVLILGHVALSIIYVSDPEYVQYLRKLYVASVMASLLVSLIFIYLNV